MAPRNEGRDRNNGGASRAEVSPVRPRGDEVRGLAPVRGNDRQVLNSVVQEEEIIPIGQRRARNRLQDLSPQVENPPSKTVKEVLLEKRENLKKSLGPALVDVLLLGTLAVSGVGSIALFVKSIDEDVSRFLAQAEEFTTFVVENSWEEKGDSLIANVIEEAWRDFTKPEVKVVVVPSGTEFDSSGKPILKVPEPAVSVPVTPEINPVEREEEHFDAGEEWREFKDGVGEIQDNVLEPGGELIVKGVKKTPDVWRWWWSLSDREPDSSPYGPTDLTKPSTWNIARILQLGLSGFGLYRLVDWAEKKRKDARDFLKNRFRRRGNDDAGEDSE